MLFNQKLYSIQTLKKQAKLYAKTNQLSLHQGLDHIAKQVGFTHWSLLIKSYSKYCVKNIKNIFSLLAPGHLMLVCADKDVGKMSFAMNLISEASQAKIASTYFSFYEPAESILSRIELIFAKDNRKIDEELIQISYLKSDFEKILNDMKNETAGSLIVIDYLQKLPLNELNQFFLKLSQIARVRHLRLVALSQKLSDSEIHKFFRPFNHVLLLEHSESNDSERCCSLISMRLINRTLLRYNEVG